MEFRDQSGLIYAVFFHEWVENGHELWADFIKRKDLGLQHIGYSHGTYIIVNEKKWLLSKLKYGI